MSAPTSNMEAATRRPQTTSTGEEAEEHEATPLIRSGAVEMDAAAEKAIRRKVDLRLCTIAGILCSLDLLDSGIISSASVTSMFEDLHLHGSRYSISIFIFTISSIAFQLPSTIAVRRFGPRIWFSFITTSFGIITFCTAFITTWRQMIAMRVLLGMAMSGIYPGLSYLISTWYTRPEQQLRFAYLQTGEVFILATGGIANFGLQQLHGRVGFEGWRWMFLVQGMFAITMGLASYFWIVDFPENAQHSFRFLNATEATLAVRRIRRDRDDVETPPFSWRVIVRHALDAKIYGFAAMFFLLNLVSTALAYFLPIILQGGMDFSTNASILLSAPPYYYAIIPVLISSYISDRYSVRGPIIAFNSGCLILGFALLGFAHTVGVRYAGTFLATGAYVSNWAALSAYWSNNVAGQWKRVVTVAVVTGCNGAGGIAGSFIIRPKEKPRYETAVWVAIGSHILMIAIVGMFTLAFSRANKAQSKGKRLIEETSGFRYTY